MRTTDTKERLVHAALELFSENGYEATSVDQIAKAVGIRAPSIYAHFKGKDEILQAVSDWVEDEYSKGMRVDMYADVDIGTAEDLKAYALRAIEFTLKSETIRKMRKLITIEQYRNEFFSECATRYQITNLISMYVPVFKRLMDDGIMIKGDPEFMAFEFIAPITLLIQRYDREPEGKDEILQTIRKQIDEFINIHCRRI